MGYRHSLLAALLMIGALACGGSTPGQDGSAPPQPPPKPVAASGAAEAALPAVVFLGDSLTAGYGVDEELAWPSLVAEAFREEGRKVRVVNAGVSGDTTAGGLARLDWLLRQKPRLLFVCLGANDGLRGIDPGASAENLRRIIEGAEASGVPVVLAGMKLPPNYGADYVERFEAIFPRLASELQVAAFIPFLLAGVAADPELNQADGIHPNADGHRQVAELVLPVLRQVLDERPAPPTELSPSPAP